MRIPLALLLLMAADPRAAAPPPGKWFVFQDSFWVNLHHFLYVTARARRGLDRTRAVSSAALRELADTTRLPDSQRREWTESLAYYDSTLASRDVLFDSSMIRIDSALAQLDSADRPRGEGVSESLTRALEGAAVAYRSVWWPRHHAANQRWIAAISPLVAQFGDTLARSEARVFRQAWPDRPLLVDVAAYSNWAGAYTTSGPPHTIISSTDPGTQDDEGLETLFHELLHVMDDSLSSALRAAAEARHKQLPRDPTHPFIFYTAGELTRRIVPGHVPYAEQFELWWRVPDFARAKPLLDRWWRSYLDRTLSFDAAIGRIVDAW